MVMAKDALATDPGMTRNKLSKVARTIVMDDDAEERHSTVIATERRGEALRIAEGEATSQWALALENLTPL